jgi:hypothetical protein
MQSTPPIHADKIIGSILRHDSKVTSYKLALIRSINDVVMRFPDVDRTAKDIAVPLHMLADFWIAYYWPMVDPKAPILQGQKIVNKSDISFRSALTDLRVMWNRVHGGNTSPGDGFFLVSELLVSRKRQTYAEDFVRAYYDARRAIQRAIEYPIRYAGPNEWEVFARPAQLQSVEKSVTAVPGTHTRDRCLIINRQLWKSFKNLSLWIEALCIHEWCLLTEQMNDATRRKVTRGDIYSLLTDRPDNRRPLTWERNHINILMMEGNVFVCPWTHRTISHDTEYALDHLIPVSVYPINDLWNLVPSDPDFNSHKKRDRLPTTETLARAAPHLTLAYSNYQLSRDLAVVLHDEADARFSRLKPGDDFPSTLTRAVSAYIDSMADARIVGRF